jgi:hypothetical protein
LARQPFVAVSISHIVLVFPADASAADAHL